jgi:hypothetical protein
MGDDKIITHHAANEFDERNHFQIRSYLYIQGVKLSQTW